MSRHIPYAPDQIWLLPPSLREELGDDHLTVFLHELVERLDLKKFATSGQSEAGRPSYAPQMLLKIWLYAYATGITSGRRIEQKLHEDLGFRYLAAGLKPDHWTLSHFRRRHPKAINDVFTQVLESVRKMGFAKLGRVAIDSTRVQANASPDKSDTVEQLRRERARLRARIRRWQKICDAEESSGEQTTPSTTTSGGVSSEEWKQRLEEIPKQLRELRKSGQTRCSRTDPESRYLRRRGGFTMGYTAEVAVSDDHFVVGERVHQSGVDNGSLHAMAEVVKQHSGQVPDAVVADSGYYSMEQICSVEAKGIEVYLPDPLLARELSGRLQRVPAMNARQKHRTPGLHELRERMRSEEAKAVYRRRKAVVEPVFGVLKQQRGMRQFRCRGLSRVGTEWTLATTAFNVSRLYTLRRGSE